MNQRDDSRQLTPAVRCWFLASLAATTVGWAGMATLLLLLQVVPDSLLVPLAWLLLPVDALAIGGMLAYLWITTIYRPGRAR